jgi:hypothetical protein
VLHPRKDRLFRVTVTAVNLQKESSGDKMIRREGTVNTMAVAPRCSP